MSFEKELDVLQFRLKQSGQNGALPLERFRSEIDFAKQFATLFAEDLGQYETLILKAFRQVVDALEAGGSLDLEKTVAAAEKTLAPIGKKAKEYTIHCCGHAHIDMNWMWPWQETVAVSHDTFATVDKLMDEFPEFCFSQSQASTYIAMQEYAPEIFEMIQKRVKEGRWDVTASMWVEGDKNIASGESLCRHMLYTRKYMKEQMGLEPDAIKIDWSPDTFGHAHTLPSIISRGGVSRYYFCRTGPGPWLFKWKSPDGSEVLAYNDKGGYNGTIHPHMGFSMVGYVQETGLKDFMYLYGVGDHGGGPTRRDLRKAQEMANWPIWPKVKLSTTDAYFTAVEKAKPKLPVIDQDLNFTFEGCYTSQSRIKKANRVSEIILPESETMAVIADAVDSMEYPYDILFTGWRHTLFNHFHDILPGSGIHATYDYSEGLFQEVQAIAGSIRTRAMRKLASKVNTAKAAKCDESTLGSGFGDGLGAGAGDPGIPGGITARNAGALCAEPVMIYNQKPWARTEMVCAKVWNKEIGDDRALVRDSNGNQFRGQVVGRGHYWGHDFTTVAFKAENVPALGYKVYAVDNAPAPLPTPEGAKIVNFVPERYSSMIPEVNDGGVLENEHLRVEFDFMAGAITHIIDKETGFDFVPEGELFGLIEAYQENPHGMSSWVIGQTPEAEELDEEWTLDIAQRGPNRASVRAHTKYRDSRIEVEIGLNAGSRMIDFNCHLHWVERGDHRVGVPMLRAAFPVNVENGVPTYEIPFGSQKRAQSAQEIPALKWADLSGGTGKSKYGVTLVNDSKYGHSCDHDTLRLTLIRSSYEPDPLPEIGDHHIRYAVVCHKGDLDVAAATRAGEEFNSPMAVVSTTVQDGELPAEKSFVEVKTGNVFVSAVKKAEDGKGIIIRLFEVAGKNTTAKLKVDGLAKKTAKATEVDVLERPVKKNTAAFEGGVLSVSIPAFGQATVRLA